MKGQHELPINKRFMKDHGERKKAMKVSWAEYIKILREKAKKEYE